MPPSPKQERKFQHHRDKAHDAAGKAPASPQFLQKWLGPLLGTGFRKQCWNGCGACNQKRAHSLANHKPPGQIWSVLISDSVWFDIGGAQRTAKLLVHKKRRE